MSRRASPRQGGETESFSSTALAGNSRENSGVFRRSSRDWQLVSPTYEPCLCCVTDGLLVAVSVPLAGYAPPDAPDAATGGFHDARSTGVHPPPR